MPGNNHLYVADNLDVLHGLNSASVDLIYLDPPFNTKRIYRAPTGTPAGRKGAQFDDIWTWSEDVDIRLESFIDTHPNLFDYIGVVGAIHGPPMKAYLTFMAQRLVEMRRVLKDTGSIYLHCDPTAGHYLKLLMDEVFGKRCFRNEIIWKYSGWNKRLKNKFESRHDLIYFYAKGKTNTFNGYGRPWESEEEYIKKRKQKVRKDEQGRKYVLSDAGGGKRVKRYLAEAMAYGSPVTSVWEIDKVNNSSTERTGYPTQKPLALLHRIIRASSSEGDTVLDPFCGCATTCVAAQRLRRHWIGIDISDAAVDLVRERLTFDDGRQRSVFTDFSAHSTPPVRSDIESLKLASPKVKAQIKRALFGAQEGVCKGCGKSFDFELFDLDHIRPQSRGGADRPENLQLLCRACNVRKGDRPMEYLLARLQARRLRAMF